MRRVLEDSVREHDEAQWEGLEEMIALFAAGDVATPELDRALDTTLRYAEFWLAVHYFEAEWLLAEHLDETTRWKSTPTVLASITHNINGISTNPDAVAFTPSASWTNVGP